jgi:hypothetical protein
MLTRTPKILIKEVKKEVNFTFEQIIFIILKSKIPNFQNLFIFSSLSL